MLLDLLFLPALFYIGIVISYQDFKEGKIRNKWIVLGVVYGLIVLAGLLVWNFAAEPVTEFYYTHIEYSGLDNSWQFVTIRWDYFWKVLLNTTIALIVGYLLWYFNLWAAGDAKLFFVFSLLLPLKYYQQSALPYFPAFVLLINTFIPILLFLICQNLFYLFKKLLTFREIRLNIKEKALKIKILLKTKYVSYLKVGFGYLLIFMFFRLIKSVLGNQFSGELQAIIFLLIIVFRKALKQFLSKRWALILILFGISFYLTVMRFYYSQAILPQIFLSIKGSILFMLMFIFISSLLSLGQQKQKKYLPFAMWMFLGVIITIIFKKSLIIIIIDIAKIYF